MPVGALNKNDSGPKDIFLREPICQRTKTSWVLNAGKTKSTSTKAEENDVTEEISSQDIEICR